MANDDYILRDGAIDALTVSALLRNLDSVENGTAHRYRRAAERIIAGVPAADVESKRRWIPVTEKPPEAGVIVWDGVHTPFTADEIVPKEHDGETMYFVPKYMVNFPIIAWMSPPEPPEVES